MIDPVTVGTPPEAERLTASPPPLAGATWALFVGIGLVMMGNGLQGTLIGVRAEGAGFGTFVSGLVMAGYFIGFLAGSRYAQRALATVGHVRVFAALASLASTAVLAHAILVTPVSWFLMRMIFGLCMAGIYVVAESWLNDLATNENRGTLLAVYMVITMLGLSLGQLLLNVADPGGFVLFILASILVSVSLVPVALSATSSPRMPTFTDLPIREMARIVPTGLVTAFCGGLAAGTLFGVGAIYASLVGMSNSRISLFLSAPVVGAVITQLPIGRLSDRVPRRGMILVLALLTTAICVALPFVEPDSTTSVVVMGALGAVMFPLYSLGIAYTNDWLPPEKILGASGALIRINGTGAIAGPLVAGGLMSLFDPAMFFAVIGGAHAMMALYVMWRILVVEAMDVEVQRRFVPFPARSSAIVAAIAPRRRRARRPQLRRRSDSGPDD